MWGSAFLEDNYDEVIKGEEEEITTMPFLFEKGVFASNGDGWFESNLGCSASDFVRRLRKARRYNKSDKLEIDNIISDVRTIKSLEVDSTLDMFGWAHDRVGSIHGLGLSDRNLKSLRKFGSTREVGLIQACNLWDKAVNSLKALDEYEDVWGIEEEGAWVKAMQERSDARKMWNSALHQIDKLSVKERDTLEKCSLLLQSGPHTSRNLQEIMQEEGVLYKSMSTAKLSKLLSMYGEELDIIQGSEKGTFVKMSNSGLIIKDPWPYAAGFLDADGYITITERGEPRAGFIATGTRGKAHCEELYKTLDCGVLQLNQKVYKDSKRSQHRLQFYSKADIRKLLKGILPHLKMKNLQAKAVLAFIDEPDSLRKLELKRVVRFENWRDDTEKSSSLLQEWGVDMDSVAKWSEGL